MRMDVVRSEERKGVAEIGVHRSLVSGPLAPDPSELLFPSVGLPSFLSSHLITEKSTQV